LHFCKHPVKPDKEQLLNVDREFSATSVEKGTYVSIWKKDAAGNWKFVLDSRNVGIEKPLNDSK